MRLAFDRRRSFLYAGSMNANLHLHSRFSDGTDWPVDIVRRALGHGLHSLALTDHDTLGGQGEFLAACQRFGVGATEGVEIDCVCPDLGYRSELLAYFPQHRYDGTAKLLSDVRDKRLAYLRMAIGGAKRQFPQADLSFEGLLKRKTSGRPEVSVEQLSFNKVDLFSYLLDLHLIPSDTSYRAFKKAYLDSKLLVESTYGKPSCEEVLRVVHADGGLVVLPHGGHEFNDDAKQLVKEAKRLKTLLDYFQNLGLDGLELYWYRNSQTKGINKIFRSEAKARGLFITYGSDCHGPGSGKETLGLFSGNFKGWPEGLSVPGAAVPKGPS